MKFVCLILFTLLSVHAHAQEAEQSQSATDEGAKRFHFSVGLEFLTAGDTDVQPLTYRDPSNSTYLNGSGTINSMSGASIFADARYQIGNSFFARLAYETLSLSNEGYSLKFKTGKINFTDKMELDVSSPTIGIGWLMGNWSLSFNYGFLVASKGTEIFDVISVSNTAMIQGRYHFNHWDLIASVRAIYLKAFTYQEGTASIQGYSSTIYPFSIGAAYRF